MRGSLVKCAPKDYIAPWKVGLDIILANPVRAGTQQPYRVFIGSGPGLPLFQTQNSCYALRQSTRSFNDSAGRVVMRIMAKDGLPSQSNLAEVDGTGPPS